MKRIMLLVTFFIAGLCSCQDSETEPNDIFDLKAEELAISGLIDKVNLSFEKQDVSTLLSLLTPDVLVLGSDPSQVFNKQQITQAWTQMLEQTSLKLIPFSERKIIINYDGNSASIIEQYTMPDFYSKITFRNSYHMVRQNNEWKILCWNGACILEDADLMKLNSLLNE